jgi:hypothetical protein
MEIKKSAHVVLATHANHVFKDTLPIHWGAKSPKQRGPVIASLTNQDQRNAIGTHSGSYAIYRALSIASKKYPIDHKPDLHNTQNTTSIGPFDSWYDPEKIVSIDPWGSNVNLNFI